jgi:hypothetical protein
MLAAMRRKRGTERLVIEGSYSPGIAELRSHADLPPGAGTASRPVRRIIWTTQKASRSMRAFYAIQQRAPEPRPGCGGSSMLGRRRLRGALPAKSG